MQGLRCVATVDYYISLPKLICRCKLYRNQRNLPKLFVFRVILAFVSFQAKYHFCGTIVALSVRRRPISGMTPLPASKLLTLSCSIRELHEYRVQVLPPQTHSYRVSQAEVEFGQWSLLDDTQEGGI